MYELRQDRLMLGVASFPGSFQVLAAQLEQKCREGLGITVRWVYDSVTVFLPVVVEFMFMCMVKNYVTLSS